MVDVMKRNFISLAILLFAMPTFAIEDDQMVDVRPVAEWGTATFEELKHQPLVGEMTDAQSLSTLDPSNFYLEVEVENDFMYEEARIHVEGTKIILDIHPKADWCECLFPKNLNIKIRSTQKEGAYDAEGKHYAQTVHPIHIEVVKNRTWLPRCQWVIISIVVLTLLFIYLRALSRKPRFKKNAMINPTCFGDYGEEVLKSGQQLRKKGFLSWLSRWLLPSAEKNTLTFVNPRVPSITFVATNSTERIELSKDSFNSDRMEVDNYEPEQVNPGDPIYISDNSNISIYERGKISKLGYLQFLANRENDLGGYRVFLTVLMTTIVIAIVGLVVLMIKSFM